MAISGLLERFKKGLARTARLFDVRAWFGRKVDRAFLEELSPFVWRRNLDFAYKYVANQEDVGADVFSRDIGGTDGNLKSLAALNDFQVHILNKADDKAKVRAELQWSTPVGGYFETRDFDVVQGKDNMWKVEWPVDHAPKLAPEVVPVTYQRWDMVGGDKPSDYSPKVRIISQNAVQEADNFTSLAKCRTTTRSRHRSA